MHAAGRAGRGEREHSEDAPVTRLDHRCTADVVLVVTGRARRAAGAADEVRVERLTGQQGPGLDELTARHAMVKRERGTGHLERDRVVARRVRYPPSDRIVGERLEYRRRRILWIGRAVAYGHSGIALGLPEVDLGEAVSFLLGERLLVVVDVGMVGVEVVNHDVVAEQRFPVAEDRHVLTERGGSATAGEDVREDAGLQRL